MNMNRLALTIFLVSILATTEAYKSKWNRNVSEIVLPPPWHDDVIDEALGGFIKPRTALRVALWPDGIVTYRLDPAFDDDEIALIHSAMKEIEDSSCVKFVPWTEQDQDYVYIRDLKHCVSYIGYATGVQAISLSTYDCMEKDIIVHELMHTLGFVHEHSRNDRDDYITVNVDNVLPELLTNFKKYNADEIDDLGQSYDYDSVMHYDQYAFAIDDDTPTIVPTDSSANINDNFQLSEKDILKLNKLYKCS